jgi:acetyl-CoA carboxylase biotin carboxyl carrier protein
LIGDGQGVYSSRGHASNDVSEIRAPITGSVWSVDVAEGDAVEVDQTVIVIESMKLQIPVDAEKAGTVARILVAEGDTVRENDVLVLLG